MRENYYVILGVSSDASMEEIKLAFRRRAMELHPDRSGLGGEPFRQVQEAYSVLSDPEERQRYDQEAREGRWRRTGGEPLVPGSSEIGHWTREVSLTESFEQYRPSFEELFERLWSNFRSACQPKAERMESLTVEIPLTRRQARLGGHVRIEVPVSIRCPACAGRGHLGGFECWRCSGLGALDVCAPVQVAYPASTFDSVVRLPLESLGIRNFFLTVYFRIR
jgi:molecular chaperone DnaJ